MFQWLSNAEDIDQKYKIGTIWMNISNNLETYFLRIWILMIHDIHDPFIFWQSYCEGINMSILSSKCICSQPVQFERIQNYLQFGSHVACLNDRTWKILNVHKRNQCKNWPILNVTLTPCYVHSTWKRWDWKFSEPVGLKT